VLQVTIRLGCCIALAIGVTGFAQERPEVPVAIVLHGQGATYVRQGDHAALSINPGEVLFSGDSFRTGLSSITILHCPSRQVIDLPPQASGVASLGRLTVRPAETAPRRAVPECEMPASVRRMPAGEAHLGESLFNARILTTSDISNPATSTEPGIARLLTQLAIAERAHREPEALAIGKVLFKIWPEAAWLRVKVFEHERATAAHQQPPAVAEGSSAVVIGISRYQDSTVPPLQWAHRDALMIRDYLKSKRGGSLPDDRIALLLNESATAPAIRAAFNKVLLRRTATVIIFIAAHGYEANGEGYIAASDTKIQNLADTGVALREINRLITVDLSGVKAIFAYVDSCNSGYLQGLNSSGLEAPPGGRLFGFAASRTKEKSHEYPELDGGHGVFSWYLNEVLTATDPRTATVSTIKEAIRYVQDHVEEYTGQKRQEQHPVDFGNYDANAPLLDFRLQGPKTRPSTFAAIDRDATGLGERGLNDPDQRLQYENEGERIVSRYLEGEADPLKKSDFQLAAENFDKAKNLASESVWLESRSAFARGRALIFDKQYDEAIRLLDQAVRLDPAGAIAYNALGIAYLEKPDYPKALAAFEDAVNRAPLWAYAWHNYALAESQMGNYRGAINSYKRAIEVAPQSPQYYYLPYNLGALYQSLNRLHDAELEYKKSGSLAPTRGEPDNALGTIRGIQGKKTEARRLFELALQKDPTLEIARRNLAALQ
jgi:tetratricopeptide (TPR) repeat protein